MTKFRCNGQFRDQLCQISSRFRVPEIVGVGSLWQIYSKNKTVDVSGHSVTYLLLCIINATWLLKQWFLDAKTVTVRHRLCRTKWCRWLWTNSFVISADLRCRRPVDVELAAQTFFAILPAALPFSTDYTKHLFSSSTNVCRSLEAFGDDALYKFTFYINYERCRNGGESASSSFGRLSGRDNQTARWAKRVTAFFV